MAKQDYYELLGVSRSASVSEIKTAYRKKAFEYHPDRNSGDINAEEMFKSVAEAYDVLSDDRKRSVYDQYGHAGLQSGMGGGGFHSAEDIFSAFGDIFEDFFGFSQGRGRSRSRARRGNDVQAEVEVEFLEACFGVKKDIKVMQNETCPTCEGSGAKKGTTPQTCSYCHGRGQVQMSQGFFQISTTCPQCHGQGQMIRDKCEDCRGHGLVQKSRQLNIKVPAGVSDGTRLLMQGEGESGQNGGPRGDLYVLIHVKEHEDFHREQDHILSEIKVNFPDLALGCALHVKTIDGEKEIKIKPGTQSGEVIKLKGAGVPNIRSGRRGDHLIHVQAVTPEKISTKQKELLEQLSKEFGSSIESTSKKKKKKKGIFS